MESLLSYICREMDRQDKIFRCLCKSYLSSNKRINRLAVGLILTNAALLIQSRRTAALEAEMEKYAKENEKVGD